MIIEYANTKVEKTLTDLAKLQKAIGHDLTKSLKKRLDQLRAMKNIGELMKSGLDRPHFLESGLYGCIGWSVSGNVRLILDAQLEKNEKLNDEILERTKILIKGVVDYHGNKNEWFIS